MRSTLSQSPQSCRSTLCSSPSSSSVVSLSLCIFPLIGAVGLISFIRSLDVWNYIFKTRCGCFVKWTQTSGTFGMTFFGWRDNEQAQQLAIKSCKQPWDYDRILRGRRQTGCATDQRDQERAHQSFRSTAWAWAPITSEITNSNHQNNAPLHLRDVLWGFWLFQRYLIYIFLVLFSQKNMKPVLGTETCLCC